MMRIQRHRTDRFTQRGAASLLVVVVLFFILALVTAYAGRNLIFEQRTSVNNMRATQAFEAAEAGLEYAISQLSGGRITANCTPTPDTAQNSFRQRHLTVDTGNGSIAALPNLTPTCLLLNAGASCDCPVAGPPNLTLPVGALAPAYQVRFETITQPGVVRAVSRGCSSVGTQCYAGAPDGAADAVAEVSVLLGLNSALATPPSAALTARGKHRLQWQRRRHFQRRRAIARCHGQCRRCGPEQRQRTLLQRAGHAGLSVGDDVGSVAQRVDSPRMFVSLFGMDRETYRMQPAAVRLVCSGGDCGPAIAAKVSANPGRIVWVESSATIASSLVLGSPGTPVLLGIHGNLTVSADLQVHGLVYLHGGDLNDVTWTTTAGNTLIQGAVIAEKSLSVVGAPNIVFDPVALRLINLTQGSMVRIPGSWRDFAAQGAEHDHCVQQNTLARRLAGRSDGRVGSDGVWHAAVVGVQSTLRLNGDIAKQRSEPRKSPRAT